MIAIFIFFFSYDVIKSLSPKRIPNDFSGKGKSFLLGFIKHEKKKVSTLLKSTKLDLKNFQVLIGGSRKKMK